MDEPRVIQTPGARIWRDEAGLIRVVVHDGVMVRRQEALDQACAIDELAAGQRPLLLIDPTRAHGIDTEARELFLSARSFQRLPMGVAIVAHAPFWRVLAGLVARMMSINTPSRVFATDEEAAEWLRSLRHADDLMPLATVVAAADCQMGIVELRADGIIVVRVSDDLTVTHAIAAECVDAVVELLGPGGMAPIVVLVRWPVYTPAALSYLVERREGPRPDVCLAIVAGTSYARLIGNTAMRFFTPAVPTALFSDIAEATRWCHDRHSALAPAAPRPARS